MHDDGVCDTFVALGEATAGGGVLLAKNSDREPNEAHEVVFVPAVDHGPQAELRCTYVTVPQVRHTHAVLLGKPYWIWGAEMGANEHGVVIGNEAVFTRVPYEKEPGLIGMDLLRLGLERSESAEQAVEVITQLLVRHGQGGDCGHDHPLRYHNGFIVADRDEAWVLETAGRDWAARRVRGAASISNVITTGNEFDRASAGLVSHAVEKGWANGRSDFDFGAAYSDRLYTTFSEARVRQCRTSDALAAGSGRMDVARAWATLGDHGARADGRSSWGPQDHAVGGLLGQTVCAHAGFGPIRVSQTTGSWVSDLARPHGPAVDTHWVSGTSAPCLSVRVPLWFDALDAAGMPDTGPAPGRTYIPGSLWWDHEDLHRTVLRDYPRLRGLFAEERADLQARIDTLAAQAAAGSLEDRVACSKETVAAVRDAIARWRDQVVEAAPRRWGRSPYLLAWRRFDRSCGRSVASGALR
jgi:secernin